MLNLKEILKKFSFILANAENASVANFWVAMMEQKIQAASQETENISQNRIDTQASNAIVKNKSELVESVTPAPHFFFEYGLRPAELTNIDTEDIEDGVATMLTLLPELPQSLLSTDFESKNALVTALFPKAAAITAATTHERQ